MGWWALTFPLGVFATSTYTIGQELPSRFFSVLGTVRNFSFTIAMINTNERQIFSVTVVVLWLVVSYYTSRGIIRGDIFVAPCLKDLGRAKV
jgi:tellurite resistance protein TehA-like permease